MPTRTENPRPKSEWLRETLQTHERVLIRYAWRLVGSPEAARDIVQEAFSRLCEADQSKVEGHARAWLFTVCRHLAFDHLRGEKRRADDRSDETPAGAQHSPLAQLEAHQTAKRISHALSALPDKQSEVVRLKFTEGLSYREIAEVTGLSTSNVGYLMHHGLKSLKRSLQESSASAQTAASKLNKPLTLVTATGAA